MHKIKEKLMQELYEYEEKAKKMPGGKISAGDLETLHKLTDTVKNIDKIEEMEGGYSEDSHWMGDGHIYGASYEGGSSYAERGRGRNARRDSMGRYSREGGNSYGMEGGSSYARGGQQGGNRGGGYSNRYSSGGAKEYMLGQLEEMMDEVQTERERKAIQRCMDVLEQA